MNRLPAAVLFDFDGTLARFTGDFDLLLDGLRSDLGLQACDFRALKERLGAALGAGGPVTLRAAARGVIESFELRVPPDLDEVTAAVCGEYGRQVRLCPGASELLEWLEGRRVPLALVSNGPWDMQRAALAAVGIERFFGAVLFSGDPDVAARKPARRIFDLALTGLRALPEDAVMVGDDLRNDIGGAAAAGIPAVLVAAQAPGELPAGEVTVVRDLNALLERLEVLAEREQRQAN